MSVTTTDANSAAPEHAERYLLVQFKPSTSPDSVDVDITTEGLREGKEQVAGLLRAVLNELEAPSTSSL